MKPFTVVIFALPMLGLTAEIRAAGLAPATEATPAAEVAMKTEAAAVSKDPLAGLDFRLAEPPAIGGPDIPVIEQLPVVDPAWREAPESEYRFDGENRIPAPAAEPYEPLNRITLPF